jgi:hypothetical protein
MLGSGPADQRIFWMRWRGVCLLCFKVSGGVVHGHETLAPRQTSLNSGLGFDSFLESPVVRELIRLAKTHPSIIARTLFRLDETGCLHRP